MVKLITVSLRGSKNVRVSLSWSIGPQPPQGIGGSLNLENLPETFSSEGFRALQKMVHCILQELAEIQHFPPLGTGLTQATDCPCSKPLLCHCAHCV